MVAASFESTGSAVESTEANADPAPLSEQSPHTGRSPHGRRALAGPGSAATAGPVPSRRRADRRRDAVPLRHGPGRGGLRGAGLAARPGRPGDVPPAAAPGAGRGG